MNKSEIEKRIDGINKYILNNSNKKIILLLKNKAVYNKAISLIDKENESNDWNSNLKKSCFKTWDEIEAFLDGLCMGKNLDFDDLEK